MTHRPIRQNSPNSSYTLLVTQRQTPSGVQVDTPTSRRPQDQMFDVEHRTFSLPGSRTQVRRGVVLIQAFFRPSYARVSAWERNVIAKEGS